MDRNLTGEIDKRDGIMTIHTCANVRHRLYNMAILRRFQRVINRYKDLIALFLSLF